MSGDAARQLIMDREEARREVERLRKERENQQDEKWKIERALSAMRSKVRVFVCVCVTIYCCV
jgi:hypothetical protein